ncbi:MAG: hypothetical protein LBT61_00680 [Prevotellaceae bacterium]|jgi:hypothetical protein|nr:hypothetical protein [Prevotellaceae bacterium]
MLGFIFPNRFYLLCGCVCLFSSCSRGDLPQQLAASAEAITQIEFSQGGDTTTITEIDGKWVVNHGRAAQEACVSDWWRVALNWQLRPMAVDENVVQKIADRVVREGIHTAVFTKRHRPLLAFYISNIKYTGTVVYYGEQLFLANMPYADYEITEVFSAKPEYWKDATVFSYLPLDLDTVTVEHLQRPEASFQLIRNADGWQPLAVEGNRAIKCKNEALINRYVTYFQQVAADTVIGELPEPELDAVRNHLQHRIHIKSAKGNLTVELFGIPLAEGDGYDTDKCLLFMVETGEWARASWVSFDLLLKNLTDFVDKK